MVVGKQALEFELFGIYILISSMVFLKLILTILLPFLLIISSKKIKPISGIYFGQINNSIQIAAKSFSLIGPACFGFWLIGLLGWSFKDWYGSIAMSVLFAIALFFIPKVTRTLSANDETEKKNLTGIYLLVLIAVITTVVLIILPNPDSIVKKILYYFFIVAVGEELLFRGYLQSSFNLVFNKKFKIGNVSFGWGLILSAVLFGLIHSLIVTPTVWPWMLFTFVGGLILGFIREKDGSLLAPIIVHGLMDFPLVFVS